MEFVCESFDEIADSLAMEKSELSLQPSLAWKEKEPEIPRFFELRARRRSKIKAEFPLSEDDKVQLFDSVSVVTIYLHETRDFVSSISKDSQILDGPPC
jgi:hypothetical protein